MEKSSQRVCANFINVSTEARERNETRLALLSCFDCADAAYKASNHACWVRPGVMSCITMSNARKIYIDVILFTMHANSPAPRRQAVVMK